jgi:hypothetical protein
LGVSQNESVHPKLESQPSPDENPESQQTLDRAEFLFGPEVTEHLKKIGEAIHEIHDALAERKDLSVKPERDANIARERAGREMVMSFYTTFQVLVRPYLCMDQKSSWVPWG